MVSKTYTYQYKTADELRVGDKIIYDRREKEVVDIDDGIFYTMLTFADGITAYVTSETQFRYKQYDKPIVEVSKPRLRRTLAGNWICHKDGDFGTGETPELAYLRCLSLGSFKTKPEPPTGRISYEHSVKDLSKTKEPKNTVHKVGSLPNTHQTLGKLFNWIKGYWK